MASVRLATAEHPVSRQSEYQIVAVGLYYWQCEFVEMQQESTRWRGAVWCFIVFPLGVVSIDVCFTILCSGTVCIGVRYTVGGPIVQCPL
jgi:hypothetical protein